MENPRAEIIQQRLDACRDTVRELRAEVERLRKEVTNNSEAHENAARHCDRLYAEVERLREERRWIPVEERLPTLRGYYLLAWPNMRITASFWHGKEWDTIARDRITHWMPLPEPPFPPQQTPPNE